MKIEDLVLSIEQMQHLKELGIEVKDTALCIIPRESWHKCYVPTEVIFPQDEHIRIPTLTLQEILEMLPKELYNKYMLVFFPDDAMCSCIQYQTEHKDILHDEDFGDTPLECAYRMLCWVAEHGYLNK